MLLKADPMTTWAAAADPVRLLTVWITSGGSRLLQ